MKIHRPTMWLGLRLCAAYLWRSFLLGLGAMLVISFAIDILCKILGIQTGTILLILMPAMLFLFAYMSAIVVTHLMDRGFGELQLAVLDLQDLNPMKPEIDVGVKVWWAHTWRTALYAGAVNIVLNISITIPAKFIGLSDPFLRELLFLMNGGVILALATKIFYEMMDKGFGRMRLVVIDRFDTSSAPGAKIAENRSHETQDV